MKGESGCRELGSKRLHPREPRGCGGRVRVLCVPAGRFPSVTKTSQLGADWLPVRHTGSRSTSAFRLVWSPQLRWLHGKPCWPGAWKHCLDDVMLVKLTRKHYAPTLLEAVKEFPTRNNTAMPLYRCERKWWKADVSGMVRGHPWRQPSPAAGLTRASLTLT